MRIKYICILNGEVYEIPISKIKDGKMFRSELKNQTVIMMEIAYRTKDRRPYEPVRVVFSRPTFDEEGVYDYGEKSSGKEMGVFLEYIFSPLTTSNSSPLPIPIAPIIPTDEEVSTLKSYLNEKYPNLLLNSPNIIEHSISESKQRHKQQIKMMKESHGKLP